MDRESALNADPQAECHQVRDSAGEFIASTGSSSAPVVTPLNFRFVSLDQDLALPSRGVNLRCRLTGRLMGWSARVPAPLVRKLWGFEPRKEHVPCHGPLLAL